jgi:hypothetical protein
MTDRKTASNTNENREMRNQSSDGKRKKLEINLVLNVV